MKWGVLRALCLRLVPVLPARAGAPGSATLHRPHWPGMALGGVWASCRRSWQLARAVSTRQLQACQESDAACRPLLVGLGGGRPKVSKLPSECRAASAARTCSAVVATRCSRTAPSQPTSMAFVRAAALKLAVVGRRETAVARRVSMCTPEGSSCSAFDV